MIFSTRKFRFTFSFGVIVTFFFFLENFISIYYLELVTLRCYYFCFCELVTRKFISIYYLKLVTRKFYNFCYFPISNLEI